MMPTSNEARHIERRCAPEHDAVQEATAPARKGLGRFVVWGVLAAPAAAWTVGLVRTDDHSGLAEHAIHSSGALAAFLLIFALLGSPLRYLAKNRFGSQWLIRNRRYIGVASFGYAVLHTIFYLIIAGPPAEILTDLLRLEIWTGWLALLILLPLAITSNDFSVSALGRRWKPLQRWTYAAAIIGLLHVVSLNDWENPWEPLAFATPLIALETWRILRRRTGRKRLSYQPTKP